MKASKIDKAATISLIAAAFCWAVGPLFIRFLAQHLDAWSQNLWRYVVAMAAWLPFLGWYLAKGKIEKEVWKKAVLPASANIVMQCFWTWSFYYINPGLGSLISKSSVFWVALFSMVFFRQERILVKSVRFWTGLVFCVGGLCGVVIFMENFSASANLLGVALMLAQSLTWAIYACSIRAAFEHTDSRIGFSIISIYTTVALAVIACIFGKPAQVFTLTAWPVWCVVISGILSISFAHTLFYAAMRRIGATIPALGLLTVPFIVLGLSWIAFGEKLNIFQWLSGIVLLAGSALAIWAQEHIKNPR